MPASSAAHSYGCCWIHPPHGLALRRSPSLVVNFDKLTYAGNLENLAAVASDARYRFVQGDICDATLVNQTIAEAQPDVIVNFAAESHVDRSILSPAPVFETNLRGTFTLLEAPARIRRRASCTSRLTKCMAAPCASRCRRRLSAAR